MRFETGLASVTKVIEKGDGYQLLEIEGDFGTGKAVAYGIFTGDCVQGDKVLINTTAVNLGLGTGGVYFVISIQGKTVENSDGKGHIMKLRYTPLQFAVLAIEEEKGPFYQELKEADDLKGLKVIVTSLHSQLPGVLLAVRRMLPSKLPVLIITDAAALPVNFSHIYRHAKQEGLFKASITSGNSFGGDHEAINIYSALLAAKAALKAELAVVAMGPGISGTGTRFGNTAVVQGEAVNAVNSLGGEAYFVPRIQFKDARKRHQGMSHQTVTLLTKVVAGKCTVTIPEIPDEKKMRHLENQIQESRLREKHSILTKNGSFILKELRELPYKLTTMGRTVDEEPEYFQASAACVRTVAESLENSV